MIQATAATGQTITSMEERLVLAVRVDANRIGTLSIASNGTVKLDGLALDEEIGLEATTKDGNV